MLKALSALLGLGAASGAPAESQAGLDVTLVDRVQQERAVVLTVDIRNPAFEPRWGVILATDCRAADGRPLRLVAVAAAPAAADWGRRRAGAHGVSMVTIGGDGFPGHATRRLTFTLTTSAALAPNSCDRPVLIGVR